MATPKCHRSRRLCSRWFLKCFRANKYEQSPVESEATRCKEPEGASQRETAASEEPLGSERKKTMTVQRGGRIRWNKAKRLLSVHRLTEGCIPHHRSDTSAFGSEERGEKKAKQEYSLTRIEIALDASPGKNAEKSKATCGDNTPCSGRADAQDRGKPQDAGYAINVDPQSSVRAGDHDRVVPEARPAPLPALYETYKDSFSSSIEECSSVCALGCQYGDECAMKAECVAPSESELNNHSAGSDSQELVVGDEQSILHGKPSATYSTDDINDDTPPKETCTGAGSDDGMEYLTAYDSKPSSTNGSSHEDSPLSVFSSEKMEAIQEDLSTRIVATVETKRALSRSDEIISNGFNGRTESNEAKVQTSSPVCIRSVPGDNLHCESFESVSIFVNDVEKGNRPSILSAENASKVKGEGENEVKQALLDETRKFLTELSSPQYAESRTSPIKDVDIDAMPMGVNPERLSPKDPENLSCPHIPPLLYERPDCSLARGATPASNGSLVASNGMEASSGILHLRRPESVEPRGFHYPPSIRAYRLERRTERFRRYFEEFLETERLPHEAVDRKSRVVNRVRRFLADGSSDDVI